MRMAALFCAQLCSGDVTALAEIAAELLDEGLCAGLVANPGMILEAVEAVVSAYGGIQSFRKNVKNFAQFSVRDVKRVCIGGCTFVVNSYRIREKKKTRTAKESERRHPRI